MLDMKWIQKARASIFKAQSGPFVALDLDSKALRVVYCEPRGAGLPRFRKLAVVPMPSGLDMAEPAAVGQFIGQSLKELGLEGFRVAMDVPRSRAVLKTLTLPAIEDDLELPGMVRYQVEKELPFALDEAVIDFTVESRQAPTPGDAASGSITVLVAAVRSNIVDHYIKIAAAAGVELQELGLRPYADLHCLRACIKGQESELQDAVLVHLNADEAEINVLMDGSLAFSRSATMLVPHNEAGEPTASPVESLVVEVVRTLQSVRATQRDAKLGHLWVAGDTGLEEPLAEALRQRLKSPCEKLSPVKSLMIRQAPPGANGYVTALGLAIGHTGSGMPLDFLHPKKPQPIVDVRKQRIRMGAIAVAAAVGLIVGVGMINLMVKNARLNELLAVYNPLDKEKQAVDKIGRKADAIEKWVAQDLKWLDHWANISANFPPAQDAYITSLRTLPNGTISLTVKARSNEVITSMAKQLREAGYDVKLQAESTDNDDLGYRSTVPVTLTPNPKAKIEVEKLKAPPRPADDGSAELIAAPRSSFSTRNASETSGESADPPAGERERESGDDSRGRSSRFGSRGER